MAGCRQAFERWMEWEPEEQAWHSYINFELRYKEVDKGRSIYERYILLTLPAGYRAPSLSILPSLPFHLADNYDLNRLWEGGKKKKVFNW